jgi:predicted AlkP superfamily pyrophosphatase or phosphodiesterase
MEIYFSKYDTILISLHAASFSRVVPVTTNIDFHHLFGVNFLSFDNSDCLWMGDDGWLVTPVCFVLF